MEVPSTDYDFASANAQFVKAEAATDGSADATDTAKSPTPEAPTSTRKEEVPDIIIPPPPPDGYYNKSNSFFDNISCENKERAELKDGVQAGNSQCRGEEVKNNIKT